MRAGRAFVGDETIGYVQDGMIYCPKCANKHCDSFENVYTRGDAEDYGSKVECESCSKSLSSPIRALSLTSSED